MQVETLAQNRAFWAFWTAQGISRLGSSVSAVALAILVFDRTGSGLAVAGVMLAHTLPSLAAPAAGVLSDRVDRRLVMAAGDVVSAGLVALIPLVGSLPTIYALVALMSVASAVSVPAAAASVPELVRGEDLTRANSLNNLAWTAAILGGSALGGVLAASVGLRSAFFVDAASFLVSAGLVLSLPSLRAARTPEGARPTFRRELEDGLRFVRRSRAPLVVVTTGFLLVFFAASTNPVSVILAKDVLAGGDLGYGMLRASWAGGMLAGSAWLMTAGQRADPRFTYLASLLLMSAGLGLAGAAPVIVWAAAALALGGTGNGLDLVSMNTLVQRSVPNELRGRVFALSYTSLALGNALALPLGGGLAEVISARAVYWVAAGGLLATFALAAPLLAARDRRTDAAVPDGEGPGLCASCAHSRIVESAKGSRFYLCRLSATDARFARYPRLPVLLCPGYRYAGDPAPRTETDG